jgi:hypothetical protein
MLADQSQADETQDHATCIPQRKVLVKESQADPDKQQRARAVSNDRQQTHAPPAAVR